MVPNIFSLLPDAFQLRRKVVRLQCELFVSALLGEIDLNTSANNHRLLLHLHKPIHVFDTSMIQQEGACTIYLSFSFIPLTMLCVLCSLNQYQGSMPEEKPHSPLKVPINKSEFRWNHKPAIISPFELYICRLWFLPCHFALFLSCTLSSQLIILISPLKSPPSFQPALAIYIPLPIFFFSVLSMS